MDGSKVTLKISSRSTITKLQAPVRFGRGPQGSGFPGRRRRSWSDERVLDRPLAALADNPAGLSFNAVKSVIKSLDSVHPEGITLLGSFIGPKAAPLSNSSTPPLPASSNLSTNFFGSHASSRSLPCASVYSRFRATSCVL
ncbi:uncharacterized protein EHS24_005203 [Apiotrichum porosum]|uniref:Uncharacterized protein n=1 Tax=Apiotrichum porosum TaxID=105984 RepID=A0A427XD78_9TREE|nr:uncharacterized protein EHS24_005203 [Apiotrichum porosum]RSH76806.1 hypothetical protein EHS24_005203 [Apiotrichum porosum]